MRPKFFHSCQSTAAFDDAGTCGGGGGGGDDGDAADGVDGAAFVGDDADEDGAEYGISKGTALNTPRRPRWVSVHKSNGEKHANRLNSTFGPAVAWW